MYSHLVIKRWLIIEGQFLRELENNSEIYKNVVFHKFLLIYQYWLPNL